MRVANDSSLNDGAIPDWAAGREPDSLGLVRLSLRIALLLGRRLSRLLLTPICLYFMLTAPRARRASREYLERALGQPVGLRHTLRHFHTFAATMLDRAYLLNERLDGFDVRVHGLELITDMMKRGQGSFLLGAHFGSFEVVHAFGREHDLRVSLVMYAEAGRRLNTALRALGPVFALQVITLGEVDSILKVEAALARGEFVGMLGDRSIRDERMLECAFLGRPARFPLGPFRIAQMLGHPVVLMFCVYGGGNRYDIHFEQLSSGESGALPRQAAVRATVERYAARLEHYCRLAPYNWYNFYDFWG